VPGGITVRKPVAFPGCNSSSSAQVQCRIGPNLIWLVYLVPVRGRQAGLKSKHLSGLDWLEVRR